MSNIEMSPEAALAKAKADDMVQFKVRMDGLKKRMTPGPSKEAKLKDACTDFEAVFITKIWEQMRASVPKEGYLHSKEEDMYLSMFDKEFSEKMADAGGIGLGDMLFDQLKSKLQSASQDTLPANASAGIAINGEKRGIALQQDPATLNPLRPSPTGIELKRPFASSQPAPGDPMRQVEALARQIELELGPPLAEAGEPGE